jgi:hypothetical protein
MGWTLDEAPGCEGYLVGLVHEVPRGQSSPRWRELCYLDDQFSLVQPDAVQVGCDCGWGSERLAVPLGAAWRPFMVVLADQRSDEMARLIWRAHIERRLDPRAMADAPEIVHLSVGEGVTACCRRPLRELPQEDRITVDEKLGTCGRPIRFVNGRQVMEHYGAIRPSSPRVVTALRVSLNPNAFDPVEGFRKRGGGE